MSTIKVDTIATRTGSGNITASGTLGVTGSTTLSSTVGVNGGTGGQVAVNYTTASTTGLKLNDTNSGNLGGFIDFRSGSGAGTQRATIQNANNAGIHVNVGTGGSVVFTQSGYVAANALDDYEEGLHTPTLNGDTSGSVGMRSGYQSLSYQVVGNRCTMTGRWEVSGGHSLSGNVTISLPFTTAQLTDQAGVGVGTIFLHRTGTDFDQGVLFGLVAFEGQNKAYIYYQPSGTGNEQLVQGSQLDANFEGFVNISFPIA